MGWFSLPNMLLFLLISSSVLSWSISQYSAPSLPPSFPLCHSEESNALVQFKDSFSIGYTSFDFCARHYNILHPKTVSWERGTDCCAWSGVTCDNITGHVIGLDLSCSMLRGTIRSNSSLFLLHHLQTLIFSDIDFRGSTIPPEFGTFANLLHLQIWFANFSGYIPVEMSYLSRLQTLQVYSDSESQFRLDSFTFKRVVTNLTNLQNLVLESVGMSRVDPSSLMNLSSSLKFLHLMGCELRGDLPNTIFHLPKLQQIYLFDNENLTGSLPKYNWSSSLKELGLTNTSFSIDILDLTRNLKSLEGLYLGNCRFIGSYPILVGNLTQLTSLDLSNNNINGQIPWWSLNLKGLNFLRLGGNNFIGEIPKFDSFNPTQISSSPFSSKIKSLGSLLRYLEFLDLSYNMLNGSIPNWLFALPSLQDLYLGNNKFTGHIQEFQTSSLWYLDLSNNRLNGSIPTSIFQQVNLSTLDLSSNFLSDFLTIDLPLKNHSPFSFVYSNHLVNQSILSNLVFLNLSHNKFRGSVPKWLCNVGVDSLFWLDLSYNFLTNIDRIQWKNLQILDLSSNNLLGHFHPYTGNSSDTLHSLYYLDLSHNMLMYIDQIPWKNLYILDVRFNHLQGHLPIPQDSAIAVFLASYNQLTGELPSLMCNLSSLEVLDLGDNSLIGKLPPCIGNFSEHLSVLDFRMNEFDGTIPATLFPKNNSLRNLNLNGNHLEGFLPRALLNCEKMEVLDIGNNRINGTFPYWLESLPALQVLILRSNRFYGSIANPMVRFPFRKLRILDLSNNEFIGELPAKYFESFKAMMETDTSNLQYMGDDYYTDSVSVEMKGIFIELVKIQTIFTTIDLSRNNFEGEIPKLFGNLRSLKGLNFSRNKLTGSIPPSFGNLSGLEWLDLSSNQLSGEIPQQLSDITFLAVLNLSRNRLVGPIPRGRQFDTFENSSYSENLGLCGPPLTKPCSNADGAQEEGDDNEQTDGFELWKIVVMGYGSGIIIGMSIGSMVLSDRRIALLMAKLRGAPWIRRWKD